MNITTTEFTQLVKHSNSIKEILKALNFSTNNTTQAEKIRNRILELNIDISHFYLNKKIPNSRWNDIKLIKQSVVKANNLTDFLFLMGLKNVGSNYKTAKFHINKHKLDCSHFNSTKTKRTIWIKPQFPLCDILKGKHPTYKTYELKQRLLKENIKQNKCEECEQSNLWNSKELKMHLDHIDGNSSNHLLQNLKMLCPNCHSQTSTYAGKNKKSRKIKKTKFEISFNKKQKYVLSQQKYIELLMNSKIDFLKFGWVEQASKLINQKPQKVKKWMLTCLPEFYLNNCFKRKINTL